MIALFKIIIIQLNKDSINKQRVLNLLIIRWAAQLCVKVGVINISPGGPGVTRNLTDIAINAN